MRVSLSIVAFAAAVATAFAAAPALDAEIISKVNNDPTMTWVAGENIGFKNMTLAQAKKLMGTRLDAEAKRVYAELPAWTGEKVSALPSDFNSETNWPACSSVIGNIRDQASCGSCWAVSSTASFNDRKCIATNGAFTTTLSAQDMTSCCTGLACFGSSGCDGGMPAQAWAYAVSHGIVSGGAYAQDPTAADGCYPYEIPPCAHHVTVPGLKPCTEGGSTPSCQSSCPNSAYTTPFNQDLHKASSSYSLPSVSDIQNSMFQKGPVTAAFTVYSDFLTYKSGVYQHQSGQVLGGHAVEMIGWGVDNGTPYWLVKNSWNTHWGDNGYFKILRGQDECGIESQVVSGDA